MEDIMRCYFEEKGNKRKKQINNGKNRCWKNNI
jgi:hypothetical protein